MAVTAALYPTSFAEEAFGGEPWDSGTYADAQTENGVGCALTLLGDGVISDYLLCMSFKDGSGNALSALIPPGATINGIEARWKAYNPATDEVTYYSYEYSFVLVLSGATAGGDDKADSSIVPYTNAWRTSYAGGPTDKWGFALSRSTVIASDFGVAIAFTGVNSDIITQYVYLDTMEMYVYYTPKGAPQMTLMGVGM